MIQLQTTNLYREIHEQPQVLAHLIEAEWDAAEALATAIRERSITHVLIAARGTSDNAARYANYLFGIANGLPVGLATPSLYTIYGAPPRFGNALVLGISQSGKSPDIVAVLAEARRQGALTAAITNVPDSDLAQAAEHVIALHAGEERSVAATKTYTASLAAIGLVSVALNGDGEMRSALAAMPRVVAQALAAGNDIARVAERYRYMKSCIVIGRGYNYATAYELALKLKELTYTVVEPYSSADFQHGPMALIEPGFPVIVVAPSGRMLPEMQGFMQILRDREAEMVVISDDAATLASGRIGLALPTGVPEWLSPLSAIVPGQLFAMHLASTRDYDPDRPRGLQKVTETR